MVCFIRMGELLIVTEKYDVSAYLCKHDKLLYAVNEVWRHDICNGFLLNSDVTHQMTTFGATTGITPIVNYIKFMQVQYSSITEGIACFEMSGDVMWRRYECVCVCGGGALHVR